MNNRLRDLGFAAPACDIAPLSQPLQESMPFQLPTAKPSYKGAGPGLLSNVFEVSTQFHNNLPQAQNPVPMSTKSIRPPVLLLPPVTPGSCLYEGQSTFGHPLASVLSS